MRPECEWCQRPASFQVHATWTMFDFDDSLACDVHRPHAENRFWRRLVDGQPPVELFVAYLHEQGDTYEPVF
jgi:hypothetical protein